MPDSSYLPAGKLPGDLLERLLIEYRTPSDPSVIVDTHYGFDAAAIEIGGETLLVKSDPITFASKDSARYLVAVNANDIACMGGTPRWMTVVSLLPENATTREDVERQFAELQQACEYEKISLIGGHTEVTLGIDRPLLIGTLLGTVGPEGLLEPGKAQPGDELWLSHHIALEGTALLAFEREHQLLQALGPDIVGAAQALLIDPGISISRDARAIRRTGVITAMHDPTEGGVATAIHEMAAASGLGAQIDGAAIPVLPETQAIADHFGINPLGLLSSGAMLVAALPDQQSLMHSTSVPMTRIGVLTETPGTVTISTTTGEQPLTRYDSDELTRALSK